MINKNNFQNRHLSAGLQQDQIDRKWRMYLLEQEMMMLQEAAAARLNASSSSSSGGGAGGPMQVKVELASASIHYFLDNSNIWNYFVIDYTNGIITDNVSLGLNGDYSLNATYQVCQNSGFSALFLGNETHCFFINLNGEIVDHIFTTGSYDFGNASALRTYFLDIDPVSVLKVFDGNTVRTFEFETANVGLSTPFTKGGGIVVSVDNSYLLIDPNGNYHELPDPGAGSFWLSPQNSYISFDIRNSETGLVEQLLIIDEYGNTQVNQDLKGFGYDTAERSTFGEELYFTLVYNSLDAETDYKLIVIDNLTQSYEVLQTSFPRGLMTDLVINYSRVPSPWDTVNGISNTLSILVFEYPALGPTNTWTNYGQTTVKSFVYHNGNLVENLYENVEFRSENALLTAKYPILPLKTTYSDNVIIAQLSSADVLADTEMLASNIIGFSGDMVNTMTYVELQTDTESKFYFYLNRSVEEVTRTTSNNWGTDGINGGSFVVEDFDTPENSFYAIVTDNESINCNALPVTTFTRESDSRNGFRDGLKPSKTIIGDVSAGNGISEFYIVGKEDISGPFVGEETVSGSYSINLGETTFVYRFYNSDGYYAYRLYDLDTGELLQNHTTPYTNEGTWNMYNYGDRYLYVNVLTGGADLEYLGISRNGILMKTLNGVSNVSDAFNDTWWAD